MQSKDTINRFVFDHLDARGCIVSLDETTAAIQQTHYYPPSLAKILNEFALAAALLHDSLKIDCSITIQLRSGGESEDSAISLIMADCTHDRRIRAIAEYESDLLNPGTPINLSELSDRSVLAITISPEEGERYQSIVPMEHDSLSACLEDYFALSEQLPTWFKFFTEQERVLGIKLHALPTKKAQDNVTGEQDFQRLNLLLKTLTVKEAFDLDVRDILTRLFHGESCRLFDGQDVQYGCVCSTQKSLDAIKSLGEQEVAALVAEQQAEGKDRVHVDCHFCFQRYEFSLLDLQDLFLQPSDAH